MLPTEWQWEYAARAIQGSRELRQHATPSGRLTHEEVHFDAQSTVDVDDPRYPTLGNGLRHMTGNVWEWMQNRYGDYPQGDVVDPTGPLEGEFRSLRGGSWVNDDAGGLHAAYRDGDFPQVRDDTMSVSVSLRLPRTSESKVDFYTLIFYTWPSFFQKLGHFRFHSARVTREIASATPRNDNTILQSPEA